MKHEYKCQEPRASSRTPAQHDKHPAHHHTCVNATTHELLY